MLYHWTVIDIVIFAILYEPPAAADMVGNLTHNACRRCYASLGCSFFFDCLIRDARFQKAWVTTTRKRMEKATEDFGIADKM